MREHRPLGEAETRTDGRPSVPKPAPFNPYARHTDVPISRSKAEIEQLLVRYGASKFASGWEGESATILFEAHEKRVRFDLPLPNIEFFKRYEAERGRRGRVLRERTDAGAAQAMEQEHRRRWRALALVIKAKLEAVQSGITEFEDEFLAHIVIPGGRTIGEQIRAQLDESYRTGKLPPLLGTGG